MDHWWCEINGSSSFTLALEIEAGVKSGKAEIHTNSFDLLYVLGVIRVFASLTEWDWCESAGY